MKNEGDPWETGSSDFILLDGCWDQVPAYAAIRRCNPNRNCSWTNLFFLRTPLLHSILFSCSLLETLYTCVNSCAPYKMKNKVRFPQYKSVASNLLITNSDVCHSDPSSVKFNPLHLLSHLHLFPTPSNPLSYLCSQFCIMYPSEGAYALDPIEW